MGMFESSDWIRERERVKAVSQPGPTHDPFMAVEAGLGLGLGLFSIEDFIVSDRRFVTRKGNLGATEERRWWFVVAASGESACTEAMLML